MSGLEMNKQCRMCHEPQVDGAYVEHFGYVVCDECAASVKTSAIVNAMLSTSYHPDRIAAVVGMVAELEDELAAIVVAMKAYPDSDLASLAGTLQGFYERECGWLKSRALPAAKSPTLWGV